MLSLLLYLSDEPDEAAHHQGKAGCVKGIENCDHWATSEGDQGAGYK
nr:hypothetical protein [Arthrobacter alpinus]